MSYITNQTTTIELNFKDKEIFNKVYSITKQVFREKKQHSLFDHILYNAIRNKPLFNGIEKLKQNNYHLYKYKSRFYVNTEVMKRRFIYISRVLFELQEAKIEQEIIDELFEKVTATLSKEFGNEY